MAKMTDYTQTDGDFINLLDSVDLSDTDTIQILLRVIVDAELGADELVDDLKDMDDAKTRDAVNRAKRRANEYGILRNKLKQLIAES